MDSRHPRFAERRRKVGELLRQGKSVAEVAEAVGGAKAVVYRIAEKDRLPTNSMPKPGAKRERDIVYMMHLGYPREVVGQMFKLAPSVVDRVVSAARERADAARLGGAGGHAREAAAADAQAPGAA